jgi:hypothetical protein
MATLIEQVLAVIADEEIPNIQQLMRAELTEYTDTPVPCDVECTADEISFAHWRLETIVAKVTKTALGVVSKKYTNDESTPAGTRAFYRSINELVRLKQISKGRAAATLHKFAAQLNVPEILCKRMPKFLCTQADFTWAETLESVCKTICKPTENPMHCRHYVKVNATDIPKQATYTEINPEGAAQMRKLLEDIGIDAKRVLYTAPRGDATELVVTY